MKEAISFARWKVPRMRNQNSGDMSTVPLENISLTIVYDNNAYKEGLSTAWGFSCLIKGTEKTILFDTGGNSTLLLANMNKLGINPKEIDLVVISHIHGDHVGGLEGFLEQNKNVRVFFPASFPARFKDDLKKSGVQTGVIQDPALICESVYSLNKSIFCTEKITFLTYSGCQKNVPIFKRFFLQPLMPQFRISKHYYEKRYKIPFEVNSFLQI